MEKWKQIKGFDGYLISTNGEILNMKTQRKLKLTINNSGYLMTCITSNDGKQKPIMVHRAVANAFIPNPENKKEVNHKDYNRANNNVDNLEWVSSKENNDYSKNHYVWNLDPIKEMQRKIKIAKANQKRTNHHIYKRRRCNSYEFRCKIKGYEKCKCFKTLDEAIKFRDNYLKDLGYYEG